MLTKEEYLKKLSDLVFDMEDEKVVSVAEDYLMRGFPAFDGIMNGLVDGMNRAGKMYEEEEYFVSDLLLCSDAMYAGLSVLRPHLSTDPANQKKKAVIGVIEGDTHDIGKNLVKIMLETAGFEMYDLGRDVPVETFIKKAVEVSADLICLSTLMTTTMSGMELVVQRAKKEKLQAKIIVGGGPLSQSYADKIGADGYAPNAVLAVKLAVKITGQ